MSMIMKSTSANELNLLKQYMLMRYEGKVLVRDKAAVIKANKELEKLNQNHHIEKIGELLDKEDVKGADGVTEAFRLLSNDFICLRIIEKLIYTINDSEDELIQKLELAKKKKEVVLTKEQEEMVTKLKEKDTKLKEDEKANINDALQKARRIVHGLEKHAMEKGSVVFLVKKALFENISLFDYFRLRFDAAGVKKEAEVVKRIAAKIEKLAKLIRIYEKKWAEAKTPAEKASLTKEHDKEFRELLKSDDKFEAELRETGLRFYKLFKDAALLTDLIIGTLHERIDKDRKWVLNYDIPRQMGEMDEKKKEQILAWVHRAMHQLNIDALQLGVKL